ncbi:pyridoxamine 5'-phosphate oxidase [Aestuariibacter salexigens]|uniref:pyridoxamine 5'-phosphate oxidase n=1 Tax=Aestuariibacter salexigens TaxID=226010 RepID=UPI00040CBB7A|nr:pyridoxamine 5'-phosphate oxidase [Aestuariibacter salexigens]
MQLQDIRRQYSRGSLTEQDVDANPIVQFERWLKDVVDAQIPDPTAMTVATVGEDGQPSQRIVLLKDVGPAGFVFYTNLESRKARELEHNNKISLHFPWYLLERQVRVIGYAEQLSTLEVAKYFASRPRESQLAAWASQQSKPISARHALMGKFMEIKQKFAQGEIPLPKFWGGFRVVPQQIEFWQGGEHRLHDRLEYTRQPDDSWTIQRLMP